MRKEKGSLTCVMAQAMIMEYINDKLSIQELEKFLYHIKNCSTCREELGVYYIILTGMKKLDDDEDLSMDFKEELERELKRSEDKINRYKGNKIVRRVLFFILIFACLGIDYVVDTVRNEPEKSNFKLEEYFFSGRTSKIDQYVWEHYNAMMSEKYIYDYKNKKDE